MPDSGTLSEERVGKFKDEIENCSHALNDACKMVQSTQASISISSDRTEAAKHFVSSMNDKYFHYTKDIAINTMLKKLQYAIKTATEKIDEMKDDVMDEDMGNKAQGTCDCIGSLWLFTLHENIRVSR